ncbi:allergen Tha p 1-like [Pieris rapae]|uniref:allergen Tha p 1-like n=1 Tax=Pieris rapae TaxID=64459 RepID=UPI001E27A5FA|nr:allergen Tha p 1-like [Pieris rapae]
MKYIILLCFLACVCARPETYTNKYDGIDLRDILSNRRLLVPYILCTLEQGKCSPEGKELRSHIKDALENDCAKCTEPQKEGTQLVITHLVQHEDDFWKQLVAKYDPSRKYVAKYEKQLKSIKS